MGEPGSILVGGVEIVFERTSGTGGRDFVLLHGGGHNLRVWDGMIDALAELGSVTAVDLRGHGWSGSDGDQSLARHVADLDALCRGLRLDAPVVVGHSFGASVALCYASGGGACRAVVLLDGLVASMADTYRLTAQDVAASLERAPRFRGTPADAERYIATSLAGERPDQRPVWGAVLSRSLAERAGVLEELPGTEEILGLIDAQFGWHPVARYNDLRVPTLLLLAATGEPPPSGADETLRADRVDRIRASGAPVTAEWIESDHNIPVSQPAAAVRLISQWLDD